MDDDGVQYFGSHTDHPQAIHWDTREWREEMEARYASEFRQEVSAAFREWIADSSAS